MKKRIALVLFTVVSFGLLSFVMLNKGGKAGYTGSPGESSCNNCHNSFALNSGTGSVSFSSDIPGDQYTPDSTYNISITVRKAGVSLFGFGLEALKPGNTSTGTFTVTNALRMQQLTAANGRKNMTHKLNGGAFADSSVFSFKWKAPSTNVGTITFYYTGVCANSSNSNSGDYVYKGNHQITSTSTAAIEDENLPYTDLKVIPFPTGGLIDVQFTLKEHADIHLRLLSLDGKLVKSETIENQDPGEKSITMFTNDINAGVYILQAEINGVGVSRKFLLMQ